MRTPNVETLLQECRSGDPVQQVNAVQRLLDLEACEAIPALMELLTSPDAAVRSTAARALGVLGLKQYETVGRSLSKLLEDAEVIVRSEAVDSLGVLRYTPAIEGIRSLLRLDAEAIVRASAAETLGDLGDASAMGDLEHALRDEEESVRAFASHSLGLLGTSRYLPALEAYVEAEVSPVVKAELHGAGCRLGAEKDCKALVEMLDAADEGLAINILNILSDLLARRVPAALRGVAPRLRVVLPALSQRVAMLSGDVEQVMARLTALEENRHG